ncbi:MAG: neutral/alkaline non-lysosomal ceramidase N-terminal domain-containing protein, partial [Deltaproteobacteria bacterium]|nr:neutral/alkaline non-lysosomal ceramidase N-terminal domain-containing protein [Deltaproteobacteria bacterium]
MGHEPIPSIERDYAVANIPVTGQLRAGAARVDITPVLGLAIAGYGFFCGAFAQCYWGRLFANVLLVDDGHGERVALVTTDLHAGTRYLVERLASLVAPSTGLTIDRIVLAASHTHGGPGHIYGGRHFDAMVANGKGFDLVTAEYLAGRIASAVTVAYQDLRPARIGYGSHPCWRYLINRSPKAMLRNIGVTTYPSITAGDKAKIRNAARDINEALPPVDLPFERQLVDARMHCIWAGEEGSGAPIGVFAILGTHPCLTTRQMEIMTPDAFGIAARVAREKLYDRFGSRPPVGVAAGAQGDSNLVVPGMDLPTILEARKDHDVARRLAEEAGRALGAALAEAAEKARLDSQTATTPSTLEVCFDQVTAKSAWVNSAGRVLARLPQTGRPTLGGSEFNRGIISLFCCEGKRRWGFGANGEGGPDPHYPKKLLPWWLRLIRNNRGGSPPEVFPLRAIRVGEVWIATVPGEPTTSVGLEIRKAIRSARNTLDAPVIVAGISGEYCGYVTMPGEYDAQHYEGSSTVWGREQGRWLAEQFARLVEGNGVRQVPGPGTAAAFEGFVNRRRSLDATLLPFDPFHHDARRLEVSVETRMNAQGDTRQVLRLAGRWEAGPHGALPPVGEGPWVVLEWKSPGGYLPLVWKGVVVDDQAFPFLVTRKACI